MPCYNVNKGLFHKMGQSSNAELVEFWVEIS